MNNEEVKKQGSGIASISLVGKILDVIKESEQSLSLSEIAKLTGQPVARLYPYLFELNKAGMISRNPLTMGYSLGYLCIQLGLKILSKEPMVQILKEKLPEFSNFHNVNVFLTVLGPNGPISIENFEYAKTLHTGFTVGTFLSFFTTATGSLYWAFLSRNQRQVFLKQSIILNESVVHYADTHDGNPDLVFEKIRSQGYCFFKQKPIQHIDSIAFPFFNKEKEIIAAVTLTMQSGEINEKEATRWMHELYLEVNNAD